MEFEPKEPGGRPNPHASDVDISQLDDGSSVRPHTAPATSHIQEFKYLDARKYPVLIRFPGVLGPGSLLFVTFKNEKTGDVGPTYQYRFDDPDYGQSIYDEMVASGHPYGEVFYHKVRKAGIPYTRM